jgi:hypothetical protein
MSNESKDELQKMPDLRWIEYIFSLQGVNKAGDLGICWLSN